MIPYCDEIEIKDMSWDDEKGVYHHPCPCGDRLANYEDIVTRPSCSLIVRVVYDPLNFEDADEARCDKVTRPEHDEKEEDPRPDDGVLDQLTLREESEPAMIAVSA